MEKERIIELTNKLYSQTRLFPKKEPLRYKMREAADNILAELTAWEVFHSSNPGRLLIINKSKRGDLIFTIEKELGKLKSYFNVAKWQNWVSFFDLLKIEEEYDKIENDFKKELEHDRGRVFVPSEVLEPRKKKILEILKEKEKIQVWEVKKILDNVSKRTLRRDFDKLLKQGLIERMGERNETFYRLKPC